MLRLSKRVEYGIIAAQFLAANDGKRVSAKEIADKMELSFDFLSKTLQAMLKTGVLESHKGAKGGYTLARHPNEISLSDIINSLQENTALVECLSEVHDKCDKEEHCSIKNPLVVIQNKIDALLSSTSVSEIVENFNYNSSERKNIRIDLKKVKNG